MSILERTQYKIIKNIPSNGAEGYIDLVEINNGERMILKTLKNESFNEFPESRGGMVLEKYKRLKESNLPVVPRLMISKNEKQIFMTNMANDDNEIIIDKNWLMDLKNREKPEIKNITELKDQIREISDRAYKQANVLLDYDAYSIIFDKNNQNGFICLIDLGEYSNPLTRGSIRFVEEDAHRNAKEFIKLFNDFPNNFRY